MADHTHTPAVSTEPVVRVLRWCSWHEDVADDTLMIRAVEKCSGPPFPLYACASCRGRYGLKELGATA